MGKTENKNHETKGKCSRRDFLKKSTLSGLGVTTLAIGGSSAVLAAGGSNDKTDKKRSFSLFRKEYDKIEEIYEIRSDFERMDQKNTIFNRAAWDKKIQNRLIPLFGKMKGMIPNPLNGKAGWSEIDHALNMGAMAGVMAGTGLSPAGQRNGGPLNNWENHAEKEVLKEKYKFDSSEEAAKYVKRAAVFLGASDVGIAPYDERWIYSKWYDLAPYFKEKKEPIHEDAMFPFDVKSVIVTIHEMDYDALKSPGILNEAAVQKGYSDMAEVTHKIAVFLNKLGYKAIPTGNDTGLSIPPALQAGLGESSRMGLLIHPKLGSRVRIAKVYTDLEIQPDKPITFGVNEFCEKCKKCAEMCPSKAIPLDKKSAWEPKTNSISSHPGVKKWFQNNESCIAQWEKFGGGCGICISVCPYNKPDTWVHDVSKLVVGIPVGRDIARQFDDAFGYGKMADESVDDFWNKEV